MGPITVVFTSERCFGAPTGIRTGAIFAQTAILAQTGFSLDGDAQTKSPAEETSSAGKVESLGGQHAGPPQWLERSARSA